MSLCALNRQRDKLSETMEAAEIYQYNGNPPFNKGFHLVDDERLERLDGFAAMRSFVWDVKNVETTKFDMDGQGNPIRAGQKARMYLSVAYPLVSDKSAFIDVAVQDGLVIRSIASNPANLVTGTTNIRYLGWKAKVIGKRIVNAIHEIEINTMEELL